MFSDAYTLIGYDTKQLISVLIVGLDPEGVTITGGDMNFQSNEKRMLMAVYRSCLSIEMSWRER